MATECRQASQRLHSGVPRAPALTPTAARELLEHQSELLRITVHELRRPLGVIDGYLSMLRDGSLGPTPDPAQVQEAYVAMAGSVRDMVALVDGLAAVTRQDDGIDVHRLRRCRVGTVVAAAIAGVGLEARTHRVCLEQVGLEGEADVDPEQLRVALVNLLSNAIRHSPAGATVTIIIGTEENSIRIAVSDHGPGILAADAERIFDPWYQGSTAPDGLGLGLWIVARIVERHRGRVTLDSEPGAGSTFTIELPTARGADVARPT